jgi:hypothetical protein
MSRGLGKLQQVLKELVLEHGKPITFAEIRAGLQEETRGDDLPPVSKAPGGCHRI